MKRYLAACAAVLITTVAMTAHAAFMVEVDIDGSTADGPGGAELVTSPPQFSFGGDTNNADDSITSFAVGTTGGDSYFGGNGAAQFDTYVYSYTPGTDADNLSLTSGQVLGSKTGFPGLGHTATGWTGGPSGLYHVYVTIPETTNVGGAVTYTLTQNGANIVVGPLNQNNLGTGPDTDPGPAFVGGMNNAWYRLGTVNLESGNTYSVTQVTNNNVFVSMRGYAVMWERVIPEPSSLVLLGLGCASLVVTRRRAG